MCTTLIFIIIFADMSNHDPTIYTLFLTIMCISLMVFTLTRLLLSFRNKNKLLSWSTCFYILCLMWTVVRSTYWMMIQTRESMTYLQMYLLYWFPTPIQYVLVTMWCWFLTCTCRFANFSLLVLFYIQVITGKKWQTRWRNICIPLYFLLTMSMATFTAVWAFNSSNNLSYAYEYGDEYDEEILKVSDVTVQLEYSAISFFMLSFLFGFFGWKMTKVRIRSSWNRNLHGDVDDVGWNMETSSIINFKTTGKFVLWYMLCVLTNIVLNRV